MTATCPLMGSDGPSIGDFWKVLFRAAKVRSNEATLERLRASDAVEPTRYGGSPMAGKKDQDATQNLRRRS